MDIREKKAFETFLVYNSVFISISALLVRLKSNAFALLRRLPWVEAKIAKELAKAGKDIEETIHKYDQRREFYRFLPEDGLSMVRFQPFISVEYANFAGTFLFGYPYC
jgi:hypothetical protein